MVDIQINQICVACLGTGIRHYNEGPGGPLIEENPCPECGGDGRAPAAFKMETTYFDGKFSAIMSELDYIHGKVTAIWNQVKPGGPP